MTEKVHPAPAEDEPEASTAAEDLENPAPLREAPAQPKKGRMNKSGSFTWNEINGGKQEGGKRVATTCLQGAWGERNE